MVSFKCISLCAFVAAVALASPVPTSTSRHSTSHTTSSAAKTTSTSHKTTSTSHKTTSTSHKTTSTSHKTTSTSSHKSSSTSTTKTTCTTSTSTSTALYDNISAAPGVPALNAVPSPYMGLYYNAFVVDDAGVAGTTVGVIPESGDNVLASGIEQTTLDGAASISIDYTGSVLSSFTLSSAYFGCVVNTAESVVGAATACTISVTPNGGTAEEFTYSPANDLSAPMQKAVFSSAFEKITNASFVVTVSDATPALTAIFLDNVVYETYSSCS